MRKSLGLVLVFLILAVGVFYYGWVWVDQPKDKILVEEKTLLGDKAVASGLTLTNKLTCNNHLLWNIVTLPGTDKKSEVDFRFSQTRQEEERQERQFWINVYVNTNFGMSGNLDLAWEQESGMIMEPILDVAERTLPGENREEILFLKDYYEYYPLTIDISFPYRALEMNQEIIGDLTSYFRIPVEVNHKIKVKVAKDKTGAVVDVESNDIEHGIGIEAKGADTADGCYYIVDVQRYHEGTAESASLPAALAGVHLLPLESLGEMGALSGNVRPKPKEMKLVYPFEHEDDRGRGLLAGRDREDLLLITEEKGEGDGEESRMMLSVIERQTMKLRQKIELPRQEAEAGLWEFRAFDDSFIVVFADYSFCVINDEEGEGYKIAINGNFNDFRQAADTYLPFGDIVMTYNGEKLAMAFYQDWRSSNPYLLVYEKAGLAYAGIYEHSSSRDLYANDRLGLRPLYGRPLSLSWD